MEIPSQILNLVYTPHAIRERLKDKHGFIDQVPKSFYKLGCKNCRWDRGRIKINYIYDDTRDLTLVIEPETNIVVTNYLDKANNTNNYKGRFRVQSILKIKNMR